MQARRSKKTQHAIKTKVEKLKTITVSKTVYMDLLLTANTTSFVLGASRKEARFGDGEERWLRPWGGEEEEGETWGRWWEMNLLSSFHYIYIYIYTCKLLLFALKSLLTKIFHPSPSTTKDPSYLNNNTYNNHTHKNINNTNNSK